MTVSSDVQFLTHDGIGWLYKDESGRRFRYQAISVGDDVFVGYGTIIMPGTTIGSRVVVGAGSVVTRSIPDGSVVAGNPAKVIADYDELMTRVHTWPSAAEVGELPFRERVDVVVQAFESGLKSGQVGKARPETVD